MLFVPAAQVQPGAQSAWPVRSTTVALFSPLQEPLRPQRSNSRLLPPADAQPSWTGAKSCGSFLLQYAHTNIAWRRLLPGHPAELRSVPLHQVSRASLTLRFNYAESYEYRQSNPLDAKNPSCAIQNIPHSVPSRSRASSPAPKTIRSICHSPSRMSRNSAWESRLGTQASTVVRKGRAV